MNNFPFQQPYHPHQGSRRTIAGPNLSGHSTWMKKKKTGCLPTPRRLDPLRGWANQIRCRKWREGNVTGLKENIQASSVMLTCSCGHLGCLAAAAQSALMAVIGHNVPLATNTHLVARTTTNFLAWQDGQRNGPFVRTSLISLIKEKHTDAEDFWKKKNTYIIIYFLINWLNGLGLCVNVLDSNSSYCVSGQQLNSTSKCLWGIIQGNHGLKKAWVQEEPGTTLTREPTRTKK